MHMFLALDYMHNLNSKFDIFVFPSVECDYSLISVAYNPSIAVYSTMIACLFTTLFPYLIHKYISASPQRTFARFFVKARWSFNHFL